MPIIVTNKNFLDNFGNSLTYYKGNAGDRHNLTLEVETNIRISSVNNPITIDVSTGQHTSSAVSWLQEGFRVGDSISVTKYAQDGSVLLTWTANVLYVDDVILDIDNNQTGGYNIGAGEFLVYVVTGRNRDDLDLFFNHVLNGQAGNEFSLIDGEATRIVFNGVDSLPVSSSIIGNLVGNQSGQFVISGNIQRLADPISLEFKKKYQISIDFVNSGIYDESWFAFSGCLKTYVRLEWASISGEPFDRAIQVFNDDANTGWYNEPNNTSQVESTLIQGITEIDFCNPTTHDVIVDGVVLDTGIGSAYISIDDTYFKNKTRPQQDWSMLVPTSDVFAAPPPLLKISNQNDTNAGYTWTINSVTQVGSQTTINLTFTPNPAFTTFMEGREEGDRLFYVWIKVGNTNHLAFSDQLICDVQEQFPLNVVDGYLFADHSENDNIFSGNKNEIEFDTEDDFAAQVRFLLDKSETYDRFEIFIEAYNTTTEEDFTLQQLTFDFAGVQISNDGRYLLNEVQTINPQLPTTSEKRDALLVLDPSLDNPTEYGVRLYYPAILRWEYWLNQSNASPDFYPTQDKNWEQYDNLGDWIVRLQLKLVKDSFAYSLEQSIRIKPYNAEENIISEIELERTVDNTIVNIIPEGEILIVRATHEKTSGSGWSTGLTWGQITIEPTEASPRWICSSVVPFDNNTNNPLTPITSNVIQIQFPSPTIAVMECYFDSSKIDLTNGVKFTSKIKENEKEIAPAQKTMTDGTPKTTTQGDFKTLAP